jgi:PAS domain S-box-containing protein
VGIVLAIAALVLPLLGARWAADQARSSVTRETLDGQRAAVDAVLGRLDVAYDTAVQSAKAAAERPDLTGFAAAHDAAGAAAVVHNVRELGFHSQVAVYDEAGALLAADHDGAPAQLAEPIPDAPVVTPPMATEDGVVVTVRAPLVADGQSVGQLVATSDFPRLAGGAEGLRLPGGVDVGIVDSDFTILASRFGRQSEGQKIQAPEARALVASGKTGSDTYYGPRLGYEVISTYVIDEGRPWSAFATSRRDTVLADADELQDRLYTGGLLLAVLLLGTGLLVASYVGASERRLGRARASLAEQNLELTNAVGQLDAEVGARRQMIATATDPFVVMDEDGVITDWNNRAEATFGWSAHDAIGARVDELLVPPRDRAAHRAGLQRFLTDGEGPMLGGAVELTALRRDGTELPVELAMWAMNVNGRWSFNAFVRDITDRAALEGVRARFQAVFESSGDAIILLDPSGVVLAWNPAAERVYGYTSEEMLGRDAASVLAVPGQEEERAAAAARLAEGSSAPAEVRCRRKDGAEIIVAVTRSPILDRDGTLVAVSSISRDITASKAAERALAASEERLRLTNVELARSNADLEDFASVAAHDLKSPLATIGGFASLLEMEVAGELSADGQDYAAHVLTGVQRMQTLIDDLLAYAQVGTTAAQELVDLDDVVRDTRELLAAEVDAAAAVVDAPDDLPEVVGDASQLRQLFMNLVSNGIKFRRDDVPPRVEITVEPHDGRWVVAVADNGIGIDVESREQVFRMFQRLHSASEYPGTGIGLAICRRVVENHGGRISIGDRAGGGTVISFDLPAAETDR